MRSGRNHLFERIATRNGLNLTVPVWAGIELLLDLTAQPPLESGHSCCHNWGRTMLNSLRTRILSIIVVVSSAWLMPTSANAQGLREAALVIFEQHQNNVVDLCSTYEAALALRSEIESGSARTFMEQEIEQLDELIQTTAQDCSDTAETVDTEPDDLASLITTCEAYGEAGAYCLFRTECQSVQEANGRLTAFWAMALEYCPE